VTLHTRVEAVTNSADVEIRATISSRRVELREDASVASWPTVDYKLTGNTGTSEQIYKVAGETTIFERAAHEAPFRPGEFITKVRTAFGSSDFAVIEFGG
jgi:hypothetical protein